MSDPLDEFSGDALTPTENKKTRKIIRDQERMDWMWAIGRIWVVYIAAVITSFFAAKEYLLKVFKAIWS